MHTITYSLSDFRRQLSHFDYLQDVDRLFFNHTKDTVNPYMKFTFVYEFNQTL
ncbi:hypothetical protein MADA3029_1230154 [Vibrio nigripulchritudo MADA3029]|uniref:Uncharacterized protein n=1 Tax=Vibrio nigripulchritudo SOn1 TaxID=1238450 RepID=A0AAV2VVY7_9VIBR|nr:hypothetical protein VIBNIMADA3020_580204 [Vibrio nigripulchritudo MADA3020]CCN52115.1 hypothetical protein VIBNIMADA3021_1210046 [Vibrio nigripulchritudo MADA3021]CCN58157.1 hypothetical protein MADA3029_1230154 [Vibrio nigripulchritudo MADA3029]CCO48896.1 hypothetical protein VIBNISOn1_70002 [Vibrio nigripulchritudo SOn1]